MADQPASKPPVVEIIPGIADNVSAIASAHAPFLYFDIASNFGFNNGIANITLEAIRYMSVEGVVTRDRVIVAHLRMIPTALASLKGAINGIELLVNPPASGSQN